MTASLHTHNGDVFKVSRSVRSRLIEKLVVFYNNNAKISTELEIEQLSHTSGMTPVSQGRA